MIDAVYRAESRCVLATLIRLLGSFELAEEALHEAFAAAREQWPREGMPAMSKPALLSPRARTISSPKRGLPDLICNTSPIQYLHQLGLLDLLRRVGDTVIVPTAIVREIDEGRQVGVSLPEVANITWMTIVQPASVAVLPLVTDLGPGETEVLALGLERRPAVVILDDAVARRTARMLHLRHTGTLGLLLDAKRAGYISSVTSPLDRLQGLGFRVATDTRSLILRLAGET